MIAIIVVLVIVLVLLLAAAPGVSGSMITSGIMGLPSTVPPKGLYYLCATGPHRIRPTEVNKRTPDGYCICPNHGTAMAAQFEDQEPIASEAE